MRRIFNLFMIGLIFWIGSTYFSEYLYIADTKTLVIATIFMYVLGVLYGVLMFASILAVPIGIGCFTTIILVLGAFILTPIKLWLLDTYLTGFDINGGFWTYVVLTPIIGLFTIKAKVDNYKNVNNDCKTIE